jgi:hypothetical protein
MKLNRLAILFSLAVLPALGCGGPNTPPNFGSAQQLSLMSYEQLYSGQTYSCIWYAGSDSDFNYYSMEHWSINADKTDGHLISRDLYKIAIGDINIDNPMPLTNDPDKWVLIWPTKADQVQ